MMSTGGLLPSSVYGLHSWYKVFIVVPQKKFIINGVCVCVLLYVCCCVRCVFAQVREHAHVCACLCKISPSILHVMQKNTDTRTIIMRLPLTTETTLVIYGPNTTILLTRRYVLIPCASIFAIDGNAFVIVIQTRQRFRKCSIIFLLSLAVFDILFLIGCNYIPRCMSMENHGFCFSETASHICYVIHLMFAFAYYTGIVSAVSIPGIITGERILDIVFYFKVYFNITPRPSVVVVCCVYILPGMCFWYSNICI